jgi:GrpB-like predicted nucleotidyltransferase (UPF0157 family)
MRKVEVVPHDPRWARLFEEEAQRIAAILGDEVVAIYHAGSTAIPGIRAKPVIDLCVEVRDIERVDSFNDLFVEAGYIPRGEFDIPGRRFFIKETEEERTHHVHAYQSGHPEIKRHLDFRDYLIEHPDLARAYSELKAELARQFPTDIHAYTQGKSAFIRDMIARAAAWREVL